MALETTSSSVKCLNLMDKTSNKIVENQFFESRIVPLSCNELLSLIAVSMKGKMLNSFKICLVLFTDLWRVGRDGEKFQKHSVLPYLCSEWES